MTWNWQQKDWPCFTYDSDAISDYESQFLHKAGILHGSLKHISAEDKASLTVDLISTEALKTSEIEGELLNRDSLQSSIRRHFGLKTDNRRIPPAEQGISEMMVNLYTTWEAPLDHETLFSWHRMLTKGRTDLRDSGRYRRFAEPMQIVSGELYEPQVHFEAPPSKQVKKEMNQFIDWFNKSEGREERLPALTQSGIAHLWFESIHPFEDGNGRIGRAISEKALSQNLGRPTLIAIAHMIEQQRKDYYAALQNNSRDLEVTDWLIYFCQMVLAAQEYSQSLIDFLIEKAKFYNRFGDKFNLRQEKVIARIFREGPTGFKGGLSAENYIAITHASRATTTRDLHNLVELGAVTKTGERRYTRYFLNIDHANAVADK